MWIKEAENPLLSGPGLWDLVAGPGRRAKACMYVLENWSNWLRVYASRQGFGQRGVLQQASGFGQYPPAPGDVLNVHHTMGCCGKRKLLMIMTSVCACASFASLVIAVATDYWLYMTEKLSNNTEGTSFIEMKTTAGLWKKCIEIGKILSHSTSHLSFPNKRNSWQQTYSMNQSDHLTHYFPF